MKKARIHKRIWSMFLICAMLLSMLPLSVAAEEVEIASGQTMIYVSGTGLAGNDGATAETPTTLEHATQLANAGGSPVQIVILDEVAITSWISPTVETELIGKGENPVLKFYYREISDKEASIELAGPLTIDELGIDVFYDEPGITSSSPDQGNYVIVANGYPLSIRSGVETLYYPNATDGKVIGTCYIIGGSLGQDLEGGTHVEIRTSLPSNNIIGGGYDSTTTGDVYLDIVGSGTTRFKQIFGGGYSKTEDAKVIGDITLTIDKATTGNTAILAGGRASVEGNITLNLKNIGDPTNPWSGPAYGGCISANSSLKSAVTGNITINVTGCNMAGGTTLYGGGSGTEVNGDGDIKINITNTKLSGEIFGGGYGTGGDVTGSITIDILDCQEIIGLIYAGGNDGANVTGDVDIALTGGPITSHPKIYATGTAKKESKAVTIDGDVSVTLAGARADVYTLAKNGSLADGHQVMVTLDDDGELHGAVRGDQSLTQYLYNYEEGKPERTGNGACVTVKGDYTSTGIYGFPTVVVEEDGTLREHLNSDGETLFHNVNTLTVESGGTLDLLQSNEIAGPTSISGTLTLPQAAELTAAGAVTVGTGAIFAPSDSYAQGDVFLRSKTAYTQGTQPEFEVTSEGAANHYFTANRAVTDGSAAHEWYVDQIQSVSIVPADITVYMGGDSGYDAVVGEDGEATSNSLPHPLFKITMPEGSTADPTDLTFTNGQTGGQEKTWKPVWDNPNSEGQKYYHFQEGDGQDKVRVTYTYTDPDGNEHTVIGDDFDPAAVSEMYTTYEIALYPGENDMSAITATDTAGKEYAVAAGTGTLTVRAVEKEDPTSDIQAAAPAQVGSGAAVAVEPEGGTVYTLNDTDVPLPEDAKPSLLFDSIIDDAEHDRTSALKQKADQTLGAVSDNTTRHYEIMYLDLVDANNGNAWITSSAGIDIYWGYPEGAGQNTAFRLLHFPGLHRDGSNSGYDVTDIESCSVDTSITVENTPSGIRFHVGPGGFSPFALVWESKDSVDPGPGTRDDYTLHYVTNGGEHLSSETKSTKWVKDYEDLPVPERDGYAFEGWYWDLRLTKPVTGDVKVDRTTVTLYAKWSGKPDPGDTGVSDWLDTEDHRLYLVGYPDSTFGPDRNMTRAEVAQMFYALLLDKDVKITKTFSDVSVDAWYTTAVDTLASLGMMDGYPDGTFRPNAPITRAEFATVALAFAYEPEKASCSYYDVVYNTWYYPYVAQATGYGWIGGYPDGSFRPNNLITRAEVTVIVNNMLGRSADERYIDRNRDQLVYFTDLTDRYWAYYTIMEATNTHDYTKSSGGETWK